MYVDGKKAAHGEPGKKLQVYTGVPVLPVRKNERDNYALNIAKKEFPKPSASVNSVPDSLFPAIDGRIWYYPEIHNRWTTLGSSSKLDWFELDFGEDKEISELAIDLVVDNILFQAPDSLYLTTFLNQRWETVPFEQNTSNKISGNTRSVFSFKKIKTDKVRIYFRHLSREIALTEIELN